ncbi:MAG TPA: choice-of-anchor R domain-containing protein [Pirellulales bacterium]|nr:choice-of-anchor R domain-containing protein [Pirellulales bacterium]
MGSFAPASASTIAFNDFGPNASYDTGLAPAVFSQQTVGSEFQSSATGMLSEIKVALVYSSAAQAGFSLNLYADNGGSLGNLLGTFGGSAAGVGGTADLQLPLSGINLIAGQNYWLIASSSNNLTWNLNNQGVIGTNYTQINSGPFGGVEEFTGSGALLAFEAFVAVPEPTTTLLSFLGICCCLGARVLDKRRRQPEPLGNLRDALQSNS